MDIQSVISAVGLLGIGGVIGGCATYLFEKQKAKFLRLKAINEEQYKNLLIYMALAIKPESYKHFILNDEYINNLSSCELIAKYAHEKVYEYYYHSVLYASDQALKEIQCFLKSPTREQFLKVAIAMRKDLWQKKTKLGYADLLL